MSGKSVVTVVDKRTVHTDALDILGRVITDEDKVGRDAIHLAVEPCVAGQRVYGGQDVGKLEDGTWGTKGISKFLGIVDPFIQGPVQPGEKFFLVLYPRTITSLRHVWEHPEFGPDVVMGPVGPKLYHVILEDYGLNKINTIKAVREVSNLGLKEAKDLTEQTPAFLALNITEEDAALIAKRFAGIASVAVVEAKENEPAVMAEAKVSVPVQVDVKEQARIWLQNKAAELDVTYASLMENMHDKLDDSNHYWSEGDKFEGASLGHEAWKKFEIFTGRVVPAAYLKPNSWEGEFFSCSC